MGEPVDRSLTLSSNIPANSSRLPVLDGLRAIAILSVLAYHFGFEWVPADLGVSLFFVLSGFLVTRGFLDEYDRTGTVDAWAFHRRRALRIFPAYYVFLGLLFCEEWFRGYRWDPWLTISGLTHTVNYYNAYYRHPGTAIAHIWALSLLEQSYLVWPHILKRVLPRGHRLLIWMLLGTIAVVLTWRVVASSALGYSHAYLYNSLETRLDTVVLGAVLAVYLKWKSSRGVCWLECCHPVASLVTLAILGLSRLGGSEAYHYAVGFTVDAVLLAVLVTQLLLYYRSALWSWLDLAPISYFGKISYSVYLWHLVCFGLVNRLVYLSVSYRFIVALALCVAVGTISNWCLELWPANIRYKLLHASQSPYK